MPPTVALTADTFGRERVGIVFGWIFASHQLGAAFAAWAAGASRGWFGSYTYSFVSSGRALPARGRPVAAHRPGPDEGCPCTGYRPGVSTSRGLTFARWGHGAPMRRLLTVALGIVATGLLTGGAQARLQAPSGDSCTFSGSGTTYTVDINATTSAQQFGFAFGAPGLAVTQAGIAGQNGNFTAAKLPANTTGAWISDTQLTGSLVATLAVTGTATGPVVIVPSAATQSSYYDPVTCTTSTSTNTGGATAKSVSFTVASRATYSASARGSAPGRDDPGRRNGEREAAPADESEGEAENRSFRRSARS